MVGKGRLAFNKTSDGAKQSSLNIFTEALKISDLSIESTLILFCILDNTFPQQCLTWRLKYRPENTLWIIQEHKWKKHSRSGFFFQNGIWSQLSLKETGLRWICISPWRSAPVIHSKNKIPFWGMRYPFWVWNQNGYGTYFVYFSRDRSLFSHIIQKVSVRAFHWCGWT